MVERVASGQICSRKSGIGTDLWWKEKQRGRLVVERVASGRICGRKSGIGDRLLNLTHT